MQDIFSIVFSLLFCLGIVPVGLFALGYRFGKRSGQEGYRAPEPALSSSPEDHSPARSTDMTGDRLRWLLSELEREPMISALSVEQRDRLTQEYRLQLASAAPSDPVPVTETPPAHQPIPAPVLTATPAPASEKPASAPVLRPAGTTEGPVRHGRELDPAVMLLYVGALMIVAAGLIYAAYNWADFSAWQKLGALAATTLAFIAAGFGFRRSDRLAPAANTFLSIGALLVPANALAAWAVLDGAQARPELPLFFGALATAIVHGAFSIRPGGRLYDYGSVVAGAIAAAAFPAAIGTDPRWGAPLALVLLAGLPVLAGPFDRLNRPRLLVTIVASPLIAVAAASSFVGEPDARWVAPATLAVGTFALLRLPCFAPQTRKYGEIGATIAMLALIPTGVNALDLLDTAAIRQYGLGAVARWDDGTLVAWGIVALATALVWIAALARVPRLRSHHVSVTMTAEAIALFLLSYGLFSSSGSHLAALGTALAGVVAMTLIAWLQHWRWLLFASAGFLLYGWAAAAFAIGLDTASDISRLRFAAVYPIAVAAGAIAVQRHWHAPARTAALPLWLATLAAIAFVVTAGTTFVIEDSSTTLPAIVILVVMGALTLLAASCLSAPLVLLGYGAIACLVISLAIDRWIPDDFILPAITFTAGAMAFTSYIVTRPGANTPGILSRLFRQPRPRLEVLPLLGLAAFTMLGIVSESVQSIIATYTRAVGNDFELSTPAWLAHLGVLVAAVVASLWLGPGLRQPRQDTSIGRTRQTALQVLTWIPLLFGLLIIAAITSMVTRETMHASQVAIIVAAGIAALWAWWKPGDAFLQGVRSTFSLGWPLTLAIAALWNAELTSGHLTSSQLLWQVGLYGVVALIFGAIALVQRLDSLVYVTIALLATGCWFGTRYADGGDTAILLSFIALAWIVASAGLVTHGRSRLRWAADPLLISAMAVGLVSIIPILARTGSVRDLDLDHLRGLGTLWLMSLAGLLAVAGHTFRRRDLTYWASGLATLALLFQINARSPENIHAYTVPVAAWLFGLGWVERKNAVVANPLFGAAAGILVVPGLWQATESGDVRWLVILLAEGLALFLAGLFLRLRVPLAAGVITISVLILRMLSDVANALPNWMTLLTIGLILLAGGTIWISFRDDIRRRMNAFTESWGRLR
ncbi:MAG TPA: hypothetical protein VNZ55_04110 [Thermomicrobiales bacterium]|nr:hypothetical protein [Thermomicrobiales bacterium]